MSKLIKNSPFIRDDWTADSLESGWQVIANLAKTKYKLDWYDPNFEVVNFEDMLHIYTGSLPVMYSHWSFGRQYIEMHKQYLNDRMGTAYEVVFNTNPSLCYLLEHNSPTMQALVQCHASVGHSSFFKNNIYFKEHTNAGSILPFLKNMKLFIEDCEQQHGAKEVEILLDMCHALSLYAIDRRPLHKKTNKEKAKIALERSLNKDRDYDLTLELGKKDETTTTGNGRLREENILKFIGKFSPALKQWQRDIIDIYCKIQQYLYPQMLTKLMNEGFASFWHHTLMTDLGELGYLEAGQSIEFLHSHCSVLKQYDFDSKYYSGVNPYKLGYEMFKDIRRICENPTEEDKEWFPALIGKDWVEEVKFAAYNFKDESFIQQYLSPKLMRDLKLFVLNDDENNEDYQVSAIHDDEGYKEIRSKLAKNYLFGNHIPDIYVEGWDVKKRRTLYLVVQEHNGRELQGNDDGTSQSEATLDMISKYWPFPISIKYIRTDGEEIRLEK
jgi:stage V sporulation protein R